MSSLDPDTPVLIGVGQASERVNDVGYQGLSPVELAAQAARAALADTGSPTLAAAIDTVAGIRQFEISSPQAHAPLGRSDNYPRSVAGRVGVSPTRAVLEVTGGQGPQHLVNELAASIADARCAAALLFGAEAISTVRHFATDPDPPDFTEHAPGDLEDRGFGLEAAFTRHQTLHGLTGGPIQYALLENARRTKFRLSREDYARQMGMVFAPFTRVAAANPHAAAPTVRTAAELVEVTERNRMIADPYPRFVVARDQVNQGAAVVLTSVAVAERFGVPPERWVFLHGHADLRQQPLLQRADLSAFPAGVMAATHALQVAGIAVDDLATVDLYSCFPIAVSTVAEGMKLALDDPRGLTVTGGLPFFGGPGNNYSMHAIAETVQRLRTHRGAYGFVGANGGILSKYSAGVYSTTPAPWRPDDSARLQQEIDAVPAPRIALHPNGWASIETWTVSYGRAGARSGIVVGRLHDDRRFVAQVAEDDDELIDLLATGDPAGTRVYARSFDTGNRVTTDL